MIYIATGDPYKPSVRKVKTGLAGEDYTEITEGVKPGEKVLIRTKSLKPRSQGGGSEDDDTAS